MGSSQRRAAQFGVLLAIVALATGIVIAAVQAAGRTDVRTTTNDGGAWLVRRSTGVAGHQNRAARQVTGTVGVSTPGAEFDVEQRDTAIAVNDRSSTTVSIVDGRMFQIVNRIETPAANNLVLTPQGAVMWTASPLKLWRLRQGQLTQVEALAAVQPLVELKGAGLVAVDTDGGIWVVDPSAHRVGRLASGDDAPTWFDLGAAAASATAATTAGNSLVIGGTTDGVTVVTPKGASHLVGGIPSGSVLGVAAPSGTPLAAVAPDGTVLSAALDASAATNVGRAGGTKAVAPIAYKGCVFAAVAIPPTFTRSCRGTTDQTVALDGSTGAALRLRLVNGWIWLNDLDTGALWVTDTVGAVDRIDDWGNDLNKDSTGNDDSKNKGDSTEQRNNPDAANAALQQADQIDEDGIEEPPVAHDDQARTRTDQPVVVKVLTNDIDPDGDVILVDGVSGQPGDAQVAPTADRTAVQVVPPPGFTGDLTFRYTITDGRGGTAEAGVNVGVSPADGSDNRPPVAVTDVAEARAGATAALNVLNNDRDPDGDGIVLQSVTVDSGSVVFDPSGQVTVTPDPSATAGTATASYVVADTFGATATGTIRVEIRLDGSNNEPDARNDSAITVVGKPVTLNVLANDTDPDNDPLSVAAAPSVVMPPGTDLSSLRVSLSEDGEFFFDPQAAGTFIFRYSIIDGSESDTAVIRVDVGAPTDNRPPVAIRDDVTVSRGGSKMVYVLQNDADPDGDVIALTGWTGVAGLTIEEVHGLGFRVTAAPDAGSQLMFRYSISDGRSDLVSGTVVVSVSAIAAVDQAPVVRPDIVDVRPGQTTSVQVLTNDYDPEGTPIKVASVSSAPSATLRVGPGAQTVLVSVDPNAVTGFSFGYDVVDGGGNRSATFVQVRLVPPGQPNRPPIARSDTARTRAGNSVTIRVLDNDSDPDGDVLRLESIAAQPAFGVAVADSDGSLTYSAAPDHTGTDHIRYVVVDSNGDRSIGEVLIGIMPAGQDNLPPTAADDSYTVVAGGDPVALDVLTNDDDGDGDPLAITRAAGNTPITVDDARQHLVFAPPATLPTDHQVSTVVYAISDGRGGTDEATVTIDVVASPTPLPPVAVDDVVGPVHPGASTPADLLGNDIDPDGPRTALTPSSTDPAIVFASDGSATVTAGPTTSEHRYTITDGDGLTASALVTIVVSDNLAPAAPPIELRTEAGKLTTVDIGAQVNDPEGDALFFTCCDGARHGTATTTSSSAGALTADFLPDSDFAGPAGFSYTVDDQHGHVVSGAVVITVVAPANRPPAATDVTGSVEAGTVGIVSLAQGASDPDAVNGDTLAYEVLDAPAGVTLQGDAISVDAPIDAGGQTLTMHYRVTDRAGATAEAAVTVTVTPPSAPPPIAVADQARTTQGVPVSVDVIANDIDLLGRGLRLVDAGTSDGSGSASIGRDGRTVTFTPSSSFFGTAQVSYTVQDARGLDSGRAVGQLVVDVVGLPGIPSTPEAKAGNATATVTWTQPASNGAPLDDMQIESDQVPAQSIGVVSSFTYSGLANGVPHRFRVRAHNEAGWGEWSQFSAAVTPDVEPGRPAAPSVQFADGALDVTWVPPANEGSNIQRYELTIGGGTSAVLDVGLSTHHLWTGLSNGTNYQFSVVAINAAGRSEPSAYSSPEHPLREPNAPGTPNVGQGDRYLDLSWAAPANNGDPIIEYQVERQSNPGAYVPSTGTAMRWSDLPNGTPQSFRVRARNRDVDWSQWSGWSPPVTPCGVPDTPAAPSAARGDQQAVVSFGAPGDQGCAIDQYQVSTDGGALQGASGSPKTFTGLTNGTAYSFKVRAHNSVGWGAWSPLSNSVVPAGPPTGPASISATPAAPGAVDLSWPAADDNGATLTTYQVSVNNGAPRDVGTGGTYRYGGLADSTTYTFKVRACNNVGCGAWSSSASATTWGAPSQPSAPNVNAGNATIDASWSAPAANGSAIDSYQVELDPGSVTELGGRSKTWNGLNNGTTYRVRVRAHNAVGWGPWSGYASGTPTAPIDVTLSKGASANGQPGCNTSPCRFLVIDATGLSPNTAYTVACRSTYQTGNNPWSTHTRSTDGSGHLHDPGTCYWGYPNTDVWATVGSYSSNHINW